MCIATIERLLPSPQLQPFPKKGLVSQVGVVDHFASLPDKINKQICLPALGQIVIESSRNVIFSPSSDSEFRQ
ncbi:hypothetical protein BgiBS90_024752, partial [Biomphalaria glabrata]